MELLDARTINRLYDMQDDAFTAALSAIQASKYPLDVRVRIWSLLDDRLSASSGPQTTQRFIVTCRRVERFFERNAKQ
jgi:hypothetical protein